VASATRLARISIVDLNRNIQQNPRIELEDAPAPVKAKRSILGGGRQFNKDCCPRVHSARQPDEPPVELGVAGST